MKNHHDLDATRKKIADLRQDLAKHRQMREAQDGAHRVEVPALEKNLRTWNDGARQMIDEAHADHDALYKNVKNFSDLCRELKQKVDVFEQDRFAQWALQGEMLERYSPIAEAVSGVCGSEDIVKDSWHDGAHVLPISKAANAIANGRTTHLILTQGHARMGNRNEDIKKLENG